MVLQQRFGNYFSGKKNANKRLFSGMNTACFFRSLAELLLTLNCFSFKGNYCKQITGPSCVNLFVGFTEHQFFDKFDGTKPELYRRYTGDCFGVTSCSRHVIDYFITSVNSFHPALKYTWVVSECSIGFLDINVSISVNRLSTSVHYKPTDLHSYLLHSSSHPAHRLVFSSPTRTKFPELSELWPSPTISRAFPPISSTGHPDDQTTQTTEIPGFKPFTAHLLYYLYLMQ